MNLKQINELVDETYLVIDRNLLKLILAAVAANRLNLSPVWLFIVGAPGSGKTEFLNMIKKIRYTFPISSMTPTTFASGMQGKGAEVSLLKQIPVKKGGILVLKDFTSMLSMNHDARSSIMAQFREVYDGEYTKRFGNGKIVAWDGKLGMLAGVTDEIYAARDLYSAMGERFIMYHPKLNHGIDQRIDITIRATSNVSGLDASRKIIQETVKEYIDSDLTPIIDKYNTLGGVIPDEGIRTEFARLAEFVSRARSPVKRDWYSKDKTIMHANDPEMPTRIAEQLTALAIGFMVMNEHETGEFVLTRDEMKLLFNVALDCMSPDRRSTLRLLTKYATVTAYAVAQETGFPYSTAKRWLDDLTVLKVLSSKKDDNGKETWWLRTDYQILMSTYENIEITQEKLDVVEQPKEGLPTFTG